MCCESEGRRCGLADRMRSAIEWFREPAEEPEPPAVPPGPKPAEPGHLSDEQLADLTTSHRARALLEAGKLCRDCLAPLGTEPGESCGWFDRGLCWGCDYTFIETEIVQRLIGALGRKAARRALKKLVKRAEALT